MKTIKKILSLLNTSERKSGGWLLFMILIMSFLDMLGIASILPFMAIITNPNIIETNSILNATYQASALLGVETEKQFIFALGIVVVTFLVFSLTFKAFATYAQIRFVRMLSYSISKHLAEGYIQQPYSWFLNQHSADLGKTILSEVDAVVSGAIKPLIDLIAKSVLTIFIIVLLLIANPKITMIISFSIGSIYGLIFFLMRSYLNLIGKRRLKSNEQRFTAISEAFGAVKEIKLFGLEKIFIKNFSDSAKIFALTQTSSTIIGQLPRFFLEALAFGGIMLIILYKLSFSGNFNDALPIISLYVFAGYRLIPALQKIYNCFTKLTFVGPSLDKLCDNFKNLEPLKNLQDQNTISCNKSIALKKVNYVYPNSSRMILKDINLFIPAESIVGILGKTGSGKTTIVDIILGLLEPKIGTLEIDGRVINRKNSRFWQRSIGYVPQHIYLSDDTIESNIAFGVETKEINQEAVIQASKIANLHEFVTKELQEQYQTKVGERGIRLSGGQRQRIGIARALYHKPQLLILDEATSALDNQTEKIVMDQINKLSEVSTIIMITHRLKSIEICDLILKIENGMIISKETNKQGIIKKKFVI